MVGSYKEIYFLPLNKHNFLTEHLCCIIHCLIILSWGRDDKVKLPLYTTRARVLITHRWALVCRF